MIKTSVQQLMQHCLGILSASQSARKYRPLIGHYDIYGLLIGQSVQTSPPNGIRGEWNITHTIADIGIVILRGRRVEFLRLKQFEKATGTQGFSLQFWNVYYDKFLLWIKSNLYFIQANKILVSNFSELFCFLSKPTPFHTSLILEHPGLLRRPVWQGQSYVRA